MGRGPICRENNPHYERTVGSYGINDEADPHSPMRILKNRGHVGASTGLQARNRVERDLSEVEQKIRPVLTQFDAQLRSMKALSRSDIAAARRLRRAITTSLCLIRVASHAASGHQESLKEIVGILTAKSSHPRVRQMAATLLAILDSPQSFKALAARVTDPEEDWGVRFLCSTLVASGARSFESFPLCLMVINHPATGDPTEEIDGIPTSLRSFMVDLSSQREEFERRLREPLSFQHGWLHTILVFWRKTQENDWQSEYGPKYVEIAASVLQLRTAPNALRIDAAMALYIMRREDKSGEPFPKAAWDALRSVYQEETSRRLHDLVRKTLMMQGNAPRR